MNTPNRLTLLRIFLLVPFAALMISALVLVRGERLLYININSMSSVGLFLGASLLFIFAMATDWLDGFLARRNNQVTTFGKLFDPLADKVMTSAALIFLSILGLVPVYITLIFIVRDIIVDGMRNLAAANQINVAASKLAKLKTLTQSLAIVLIMLVAPALNSASWSFYNPSYELWLLNLLLIVSAALAILSGYQYFLPIRKLLVFK